MEITRLTVALILIACFILINFWASACALEGSWQSTGDFTESGTKILLNIQGKFYTSCRVVLIQNEAVVEDGNLIFIGYNPGSLLWFPSRGVVINKGFACWPKKMWYKFNALQGTLKLYNKQVYADLVKLA